MKLLILNFIILIMSFILYNLKILNKELKMYECGNITHTFGLFYPILVIMIINYIIIKYKIPLLCNTFSALMIMTLGLTYLMLIFHIYI